MKIKFKTISVLLIAIVASLVLAACTVGTGSLEDYREKGYSVKITYDGNGGEFIGKVGNKVVDMYNPNNYTADENGYVHIKLTDPTKRVLAGIEGSNEEIKLTMSGYSNIGWYRQRNSVLNEQGELIDEAGNVLTYDGSKYYIKGTETESFPLYEYAQPFNFETDTIDVKQDEKSVDVTLYAGWIKYFEFDFYHVLNGEATLVDTFTFDYKSAKLVTNASGKDVISLPLYSDGAMNYSFKYDSGELYNFPQIEGRTFEKAYEDEELTKEITTETFAHKGTVDTDTCKAFNSVQKIYFTTLEGNIYKISKASELVNHPDPEGIYEISGDLDFEGLSWPIAFSQGAFEGKMYSVSGETVKFSNINARFASASFQSAGVFGELGDGAVLENISFENVTLTVSSVPSNARDMNIGTLFGIVSDKAELTNISLTNATLVIGYVSINTDANNNAVNLLGNGNVSGVTVTDTIHLRIEGRKVGSTYRFMIDPENVTVSAGNDVSFVAGSFKNENEVIDIQ